MWEQQLAFWVLALAMAGAAIGVVRSRNVVHAALFLVVVMAGAAAQYILLVAEFVAWVQVLIYIGAVIILFLFGIMLTRAPMRGEGRSLDNDQRWAGAVVSLFLFGVLTALLVDAFGNDKIKFSNGLVHQGSTANVGTQIFQNYLVPFEVVSMLLLGALIGAIVLARRD
jgi:NADH-quinone oxidoreductase subunit J